jgi:hypothetical protein
MPAAQRSIPARRPPAGTTGTMKKSTNDFGKKMLSMSPSGHEVDHARDFVVRAATRASQNDARTALTPQREFSNMR